MTDTGPAVALLFDDTELGGHLREALHERGARIVHEGGVSSLSRDLLQQTGAEVLVVNLDDSADDALDQLYEVIDGDHPRVVFNDAQASRSLEGWDRARWARHLAVKVLAMGDIDPPRPSGAPIIEPPVAAEADQAGVDGMVVESDLAAEMGSALEEVATGPDSTPTPDSNPEAGLDLELELEREMESDLAAYEVTDDQHEPGAVVDPESLAAELEALLASGQLPEDDVVESGPGLRFVDGEEPPPLHDGDFAGFGAEQVSAQPLDPVFEQSAQDLQDESPSAPEADPFALFSADELLMSEAAAEGELSAGEDIPAVTAPDWDLVDDEAPASTAAPEQKPDPAEFGIEKMSAADFLAPDIEAVDDDLQPKMTLELMSMEEAVAPQAYAHDSEMVLDELGSALSRVVLLGAATDGIDSVCAFLAALPSSTRLTILLTQHLGKQSDASLVAEFSANCALPVRLARGERAVQGEVLLVPAGQQVRLRRDGSIDLQPSDAGAEQDPSIDASLTMAANVFGRDALAIIFAGRGNDAVAGAQAIHDRGGQVWVEASSGDHFGDMVSGIFAERLVDFSGTPPELAARLLEVFP